MRTTKITFNINRLIPTHLLADHNGWALAKAIEKAFEIVSKAAEDGIALIQDIDTMPEWRLDELAWEYGIPYDYTADIEQKREWIRHATKMYRVLGTREAVAQYLRGYFNQVDVEENWEYGGDPYHFRVWLGGVYTPQMDEWTRKSVEMAKNARSVLDTIWAKNRMDTNLYAGTISAAKNAMSMANDVKREAESSIGPKMAVAAIGEILSTDIGNHGREEARTLTGTGYAGTALAAHVRHTMNTMEVG